jgi:hypothetical protein
MSNKTRNRNLGSAANSIPKLSFRVNALAVQCNVSFYIFGRSALLIAGRPARSLAIKQGRAPASGLRPDLPMQLVTAARADFDRVESRVGWAKAAPKLRLMHGAGSAVPTRSGVAKGCMRSGLSAWARRNAHRADAAKFWPPLPTLRTASISSGHACSSRRRRNGTASSARRPVASPSPVAGTQSSRRW